MAMSLSAMADLACWRSVLSFKLTIPCLTTAHLSDNTPTSCSRKARHAGTSGERAAVVECATAGVPHARGTPTWNSRHRRPDSRLRPARAARLLCFLRSVYTTGQRRASNQGGSALVELAKPGDRCRHLIGRSVARWSRERGAWEYNSCGVLSQVLAGRCGSAPPYRGCPDSVYMPDSALSISNMVIIA